MAGPRALVRIFAARPILSAAILAAGGALTLWAVVPNTLAAPMAAVLSWDAGAVVYLLLLMRLMRRCGPREIQDTAARQDAGDGWILALVVLAAAASVGVLAEELMRAKLDHGLVRALRLALVFATLAGSWFVVQAAFAVHYAHEYYADAPDAADGRGVAGGLQFPGDQAPDYWDFLHFSVVIGLACQTADIAFTSKTLRRIGTVHGVVAFLFNTVVLALTINLLASIF